MEEGVEGERELEREKIISLKKDGRSAEEDYYGGGGVELMYFLWKEKNKKCLSIENDSVTLNYVYWVASQNVFA